ncbi:MAG: hypothetical protein HXX12_05095 [Geothrix sp.]|uniref:hypothetical protein n=1 Tax=Geothrix sp. TaxID=1962974 RepID=UPI00184852FC|nr:hypothetical protein [Geothrix sp.]NWJ40331.1 hypothetical protein [Geothrix sp.]WIL21663.1 MAG: hypothetical protein QOZ81_000932 [Geothrix sp.]
MNLKFEAVNLALWLHFITVTVGGGAAIVTLLLSGFEEGKEDIQGLAATIWAKVVAWAFRLALIAGIALLVLMIQGGQNPFKAGTYFHIKLVLVLILVGLSEMTPKALAQGRRGSALLVVVFFLAASFTVFNKGLFLRQTPKAGPEVPVTAATTPAAR